MGDFDERKYWLERHEQFRGDMRSVGNRSASPERAAETLQRLEGLLRLVLRARYGEVTGRSVLDLGCGVGRLAPLFARLDWRYHGVDLSPVAIEQSREAYPEASFEVGDITAYRSDQPFDLVVIWAVLLHLVDVEDWKAALSTVAAAVEAGGSFLLIDTIPVESMGKTAPHVRFRTRDEYRAALKAEGLGFDETWIDETRDALVAERDLKPKSLDIFHFVDRIDS